MSVQICGCGYVCDPIFYWLDVIILTAICGGEINDHALRGASGKRLLVIGHQMRMASGGTPVLHRPQKYVISPIFCTNLRLEAPLPVYFSCTTFRRSATTSATVLTPKCTTRRWTLRCSNDSVAKRQQLSCAVSTATLSLKFENVVPEGWI